MNIDLQNLDHRQTIKFRELLETNKFLYINFIEDLYIKSDKSLNLKLSSITSRDLYLNDLLIRFTELSLIRYYLKNHKVEKIVIFDSTYSDIINNFSSKNIYQLVIRNHNNYNKYLKLLKNILNNLYYIFLTILLKSKKRKKILLNTNNAALIFMPIISSMFKNKTFEDRYFPGINEHFKKMTPFYFPIFDSNINYFNSVKVLNNERNAIFDFDILPIKTYLQCFTNSIIYCYKYTNVNFDGMNVTELVNNQMKQDYYGQYIFKNLIIYHFAALICQIKNFKIFISWFENQQINRAFNMAVNKYSSDVTNIGYQGYIVSDIFYYFHYPTKFEMKIGSIPQKIAVISSKLTERISKYTHVDTIVAPAFRNTKMLSSEIKYEEGKQIIISLPVNISNSKKIMEFLSNTTILNYREKLLVNYHPVLQIKYLSKEHLEKFRFTSLSFQDLINDASLVISNSSSVCLQAIAQAVPVIIIDTMERINMNPIPKDIDKSIWDECHTVNDYENMFYEKYHNYDKLKYESIAKYVKDNYFIKLNSESIKTLSVN